MFKYEAGDAVWSVVFMWWFLLRATLRNYLRIRDNLFKRKRGWMLVDSHPARYVVMEYKICCKLGLDKYWCDFKVV